MSDKSVFKDFIVLNASPLIVLLKSELDYILPSMFDRIAVPNAVWHEVTVCEDKACKNLKEAMWAVQVSIQDNRWITENTFSIPDIAAFDKFIRCLSGL